MRRSARAAVAGALSAAAVATSVATAAPAQAAPARYDILKVCFLEEYNPSQRFSGTGRAYQHGVVLNVARPGGQWVRFSPRPVAAVNGCHSALVYPGLWWSFQAVHSVRLPQGVLSYTGSSQPFFARGTNNLTQMLNVTVDLRGAGNP